MDKHLVKESITIEDIEVILESLNAHFYREGDDKLVIETICHNGPGEGSHKLYYYTNTGLFNCYTSCGHFDIFELVSKVLGLSLSDSISYVVRNKGFTFLDFSEGTEGAKELSPPPEYKKPELKEYDSTRLDSLPDAVVSSWLEEGITIETQREMGVKYNPVDGAIVFPHRDEAGRLVGIRQRNMSEESIRNFGKYRPATMRGIMYTSPLSFYLYNMETASYPIRRTKRAIVFEGEKSTALYGQYFGKFNNNSVASFGMNLSMHQYKILEEQGVEEIVVAFDRQFKVPDKSDEEFVSLIRKFRRIARFQEEKGITISFMIDFDGLLDYKDSPIDKGPEVFNLLFESRVILEEPGEKESEDTA